MEINSFPSVPKEMTELTADLWKEEQRLDNGLDDYFKVLEGTSGSQQGMKGANGIKQLYKIVNGILLRKNFHNYL